MSPTEVAPLEATAWPGCSIVELKKRGQDNYLERPGMIAARHGMMPQSGDAAYEKLPSKITLDACTDQQLPEQPHRTVPGEELNNGHEAALTERGRKLAYMLKNTSVLSGKDKSILPAPGKQQLRELIDRAGCRPG
jgi:hypothetical protein